MTITSITKDGGYLVIIEDGVTKRRSIVYEDTVVSEPPTGYEEVGNIYVNSSGNLVVNYNGSSFEIEGGATADQTEADIKTLFSWATSPEDGSTADQTGAEIVVLLEALTAGNRLSHTKLDDVGASDHHAKYTNAEAVAAVKAGNYVPRTYVWFVPSTLTAGTEQAATFRMKRATTVEDIELHVKTAPTGAALIIDINDGGTTLFDDGDSGVKPEIDIGGTTEDDNHVFTDTAIAAGAELTMDIDQIGSTIAGADLTVLLHCKEAVI